MSNWKYPHTRDLRELVRFADDGGAIWLGENRMLLFHAASMGTLRRELIRKQGVDEARRMLTGIGYEAGLLDAEIARHLRPTDNLFEAFFTGPQLHMLEGSVRVTPVALDLDLRAGHFAGEFLWHNSWEAEAHLRDFGRVSEPVCWMQIGYASGYTSGFLGRPVLFRETECAGCGGDHCRIVGKLLEEWDDESARNVPHVPALLSAWPVTTSAGSEVAPPPGPALIGASESFRRAYDLTLRAAGTTVTVLLLGETGVGKERFARTLHAMSPRKDGPFIAVNCAAIPHELIESELFGAEKGAYTGAHSARAGKFERADGGTLFLDEIGEMPLAAQAKVLRALQEGEIERLGDERTRKVNVRLVAATHVELAEAVLRGQFRADLYYRINVYPVRIPPLRERIADIPPLVEALVARFNATHVRHVRGLTDRAMFALRQHNWPGNIRELENVIERGVILAPQDGLIEAKHLFSSLEAIHAQEAQISDKGRLEPADRQVRASHLFDSVIDAGLSLDELETLLLEEAVARADGNLSGAARTLGLTRPQLSYRLKKGVPGSAP